MKGTRKLLGERPRWKVIAAGTALLALLACFDWLTGTQLTLGPFYQLPVAVVAWWAGRRAGVAMALLSSLVWGALMLHEKSPSQQVMLVSGNTALRALFYVFTAIVLSVWHDMGRRLEEMVDARTAALQEEVRERQQAQAAVQSLAAELAAAEDAHRRQLAHDLHDAVGQNLSLLKLNLQGLRRDAPGDGDANGAALRRRLEDEIGSVDRLIEQARTLTFDLYPAMLDDLGLAPTLEWYSEEFHRRTGARVIISEQGPRMVLPTSVAHYLFRAIKELLGNAAKHGAAGEIVVALYWRGNDVRVVVDDDGRGFDAGAALATGQRRGLGLASIRERVTATGGSLQLESQPGQGARVILQVPVAQPVAHA